MFGWCLGLRHLNGVPVSGAINMQQVTSSTFENVWYTSSNNRRSLSILIDTNNLSRHATIIVILNTRLYAHWASSSVTDPWNLMTFWFRLYFCRSLTCFERGNSVLNSATRRFYLKTMSVAWGETWWWLTVAWRGRLYVWWRAMYDLDLRTALTLLAFNALM